MTTSRTGLCARHQGGGLPKGAALAAAAPTRLDDEAAKVERQRGAPCSVHCGDGHLGRVQSQVQAQLGTGLQRRGCVLRSQPTGTLQLQSEGRW